MFYTFRKLQTYAKSRRDGYGDAAGDDYGQRDLVK